MSEERMNDKEWAELQRNRAELQRAVATHGRETIRQVMKDAIQLPSKRGDLRK